VTPRSTLDGRIALPIRDLAVENDANIEGAAHRPDRLIVIVAVNENRIDAGDGALSFRPRADRSSRRGRSLKTLGA
jgi:hypothetical protein